MSFLFGKFTFLPCQRLLCIVKASMVTVRCFVWTCEKHFPLELYLGRNKRQSVTYYAPREACRGVELTKVFRQKWKNRFHLLKKLVEHVIDDLFGPSTVQLGYFLPLGTIRIESAELAAGVPKQDEKVFALRPADLLQDPRFGFPVHRAGEDAVLHGVQHYVAIRLGYRQFIQSWACSGDKWRVNLSASFCIKDITTRAYFF